MLQKSNWPKTVGKKSLIQNVTKRSSTEKYFAKKHVAEISLKKKTIIGVSKTKTIMSKNHWPISCSEKGVRPKSASEKGLWPKSFWYWKDKWSKFCHDQEVFWQKNIGLRISLWKNCCSWERLPWIFVKEKSLTKKVKDWKVDKNLFCRGFTVQNFFNIEEFSKQNQNLWSVKDTKGANAKTKVRFQKIIFEKTEVLK